MNKLKPAYLGLLTAAVMISVLLAGFYVFHLPAQSNLQVAVYTLYSAGIVLCLYLFHQNSQAPKTLKEYFSEGFKMFIVVVLLMVVYTFVFVKMNPQIINGFIEENNRELMKQGNRTQAEILENADKIRSMFLLTMVMGATIIYLIIGALVALIGGAFLSQRSANKKAGQ